MKPFTFATILCILFGFLGSSFAATNRTISDISSIPHRVLKRGISPKFYKTLLNSPVEGCVIVRGQVSRTSHLSGLRVAHSELNGAYDSLALKRAADVRISGYYSLDKLTPTGNVLVHLLIYKIADGTLALSFAQLDEPGGDQQDYYGCAVLETQDKNGKWTAIKSVDSLQDKGIVLRNVKNSKFAMREVWFFAGFKP